MSSTDSDELGKVVGMPLERVVGMAWNEWTASIGIDGRHGPDYALYEKTLLGRWIVKGKISVEAMMQGASAEIASLADHLDPSRLKKRQLIQLLDDIIDVAESTKRFLQTEAD